MDEDQKDQEPTVVVVNAYPTPKQQLTSAAVQLGIALAIPAALAAAGGVVVGYKAVKTRFTRKAPVLEIIVNDEDPDSTDE